MKSLSIISILIGIAIDQGHIKSINQKVLNFFPDYKVKEGEKAIQNITLKELLTMTAPYKYIIPPLPFEKIGNPNEPRSKYIVIVKIEYFGLSIKTSVLMIKVCKVKGEIENGKGITIYELIHSNARNIAILVISLISILLLFMLIF